MENKKDSFISNENDRIPKDFPKWKTYGWKIHDDELFYKALCYQEAILHLIGYFIVTFEEISFQKKNMSTRNYSETRRKKNETSCILKISSSSSDVYAHYRDGYFNFFFRSYSLEFICIHRIICQIIICFLKHWENEIAPWKKKHNSLRRKKQTNFCFVIS